MSIIEEVHNERGRWICTTGYSPDYVVLGQIQYRQYKLLAAAMCIMESTVQRERLYGMDIIEAANRESCILFGQSADSPCG